jgi:hypothetical protein
MIDTILDEVNMPELKSELEVLIDKTYIENLKIRFCDLIGLDYRLHYEKYQEYIDSLFETFNNLSRKFLPNYYATDVYSLDSDVTYLFDFSNFFQKFLVDNKKTLISTNLLFNHSKQLNYTKVGFIKEKVEEFFSQDLLSFEQTDSVVNDILDFVMEYNSFFKEFEKENDIKEVIYKQYIINANRDYIYANKRVYGKLSYLYESGKIELKTLNIIINALIKTNKRNNFKNENIIGLKLYKDYLTYFILADSYYKFVIEPYSNFEINFAKVFINDKELMMSHTCNENGRILVSQKIEFEKIVNVLEYNMAIKINGNEYNSDLFDNK